MRKYVLTSPKFTGNVTFWYNEYSALVFYHNEAEMNLDQHAWLLKHLPLSEAAIDPMAAKIEGSLQELPEDLSFDRFWDIYGKKINRKRCEPIWKKMTDAERLEAIMQIKPYEKYLQATSYRGKADPENYLRRGYYETDWKKEK